MKLFSSYRSAICHYVNSSPDNSSPTTGPLTTRSLERQHRRCVGVSGVSASGFRRHWGSVGGGGGGVLGH